MQLVIKTSAQQPPRLLKVLPHHHSYETPELVVLDTSAVGSYGDWLVKALAPR